MKREMRTLQKSQIAGTEQHARKQPGNQAWQFKDNRPATGETQALQQQIQESSQGVCQRLKIGKATVSTTDQLAEKLGKERAQVIDKFNAKLGDLPSVDNATLNNYLVAKKTKVNGGNLADFDQYIGRLVESYKRTYMERNGGQFLTNLATVESGQDYQTLVDEQGAINYLDGEEDGASVGDGYDKSLACTLFALLELKPGFLGATNPKELHYILRLNPQTKAYDEDKQVAKIRLSAGLNYRAPGGNENTVAKFINTLGQGQQGNRYIIDPAGQAHTFVLKHNGNRWMQIDNDDEGGVIPKTPNAGIRVIWF